MTLVTGRPGAAVVLAAVDDSVAAVAVARAAGETALTRGAQVVVFTAVGVLPEHRVLAGLGWIDEPESVAEDAEATLGRVRPMVDRLGVSYQIRVGVYMVRGGRWGRARQIASAIQRATDEAAALVVIGHTSNRRAARCSVAGRLLRRSTRDVLVLPVNLPVPRQRDAHSEPSPTRHSERVASWWLRAVAAWVVWGLWTAWLVGRLGRCRFGGWVIGTFLGPLSLPAILALAHADRRQPPAPLPLSHHSRPGAFRVLVSAADPAGLLADATAAHRHLVAGDPGVTLVVVDLAPTGPTLPSRPRDELDERLPAPCSALPKQPSTIPRGWCCSAHRAGRWPPNWAESTTAAPCSARTGWPGGRRALARLAVGATTPTLTAGRTRPAPPQTTPTWNHDPRSHP